MPKYKYDYDNDLRNFAAYRKRHPIKSSARVKERSRMRQVIIAKGYRPYPSDEVWDGFSACSMIMSPPDWPHTLGDDLMKFDEGPLWDGRRIFLGPALKRQMRKMIVEGYFKGH